jgi:hypothetical protein
VLSNPTVAMAIDSSDEAVPLLTLTGTVGVGKTWLALTIATEVVPHFADGVEWVDSLRMSSCACTLIRRCSCSTCAARVSYCTGDLTRATALYAENLVRAQHVGYIMIVASPLFGLAGIADRVFISPRPAGSHVANVPAKLVAAN